MGGLPGRVFFDDRLELKLLGLEAEQPGRPLPGHLRPSHITFINLTRSGRPNGIMVRSSARSLSARLRM